MAKKPETVRLPVNLLMASSLCSSSEEGRHYLCGVYLKAVGKTLRVVSTDGHRMLVLSRELEDANVPAWLRDGLILSNASLKERLALMARVSFDLSVKMEDRFVLLSQSGDFITLKDPRGDCVFRVQVVDGTFPDYEKVMASISDSIFTGVVDKTEGEAKDIMVGGPVPIGFRSQYVKSIADVARLLGSETVALRTSSAENGAMVTFPEADGAVLYVMPAKIAAHLGTGTCDILSLPLRRSLAALKAHVTRNKGWAKGTTDPSEKAGFASKATEFEGRIVALIEQAPSLKALPAPKAKKASNAADKASGKSRSKANGQTKPDATPKTAKEDKLAA